jgi:predicted secreted protein
MRAKRNQTFRTISEQFNAVKRSQSSEGGIISQAFTGMGLAFQKGNNNATGSPPTGETFTSISEVQQVDLSGSKVDLVDVTNVQSVGARREFIATLIDSGEASCTANFIPSDATQVALQAQMDSRAACNWKIVLPGGLGTFSFAGLVSTIDHNLDFSKEAKLTFKVKITGPIAFA